MIVSLPDLMTRTHVSAIADAATSFSQPASWQRKGSMHAAHIAAATAKSAGRLAALIADHLLILTCLARCSTWPTQSC